uniref:Uncharacterized protein n=1 Tax=Plectus sambesii TaxID=2011161 RepID=A0A914XJF3_9BILA
MEERERFGALPEYAPSPSSSRIEETKVLIDAYESDTRPMRDEMDDRHEHFVDFQRRAEGSEFDEVVGGQDESPESPETATIRDAWRNREASRSFTTTFDETIEHFDGEEREGVDQWEERNKEEDVGVEEHPPYFLQEDVEQAEEQSEDRYPRTELRDIDLYYSHASPQPSADFDVDDDDRLNYAPRQHPHAVTWQEDRSAAADRVSDNAAAGGGFEAAEEMEDNGEDAESTATSGPDADGSSARDCMIGLMIVVVAARSTSVSTEGPDDNDEVGDSAEEEEGSAPMGGHDRRSSFEDDRDQRRARRLISDRATIAVDGVIERSSGETAVVAPRRGIASIDNSDGIDSVAGAGTPHPPASSSSAAWPTPPQPPSQDSAVVLGGPPPSLPPWSAPSRTDDDEASARGVAVGQQQPSDLGRGSVAAAQPPPPAAAPATTMFKKGGGFGGFGFGGLKSMADSAMKAADSAVTAAKAAGEQLGVSAPPSLAGSRAGSTADLTQQQQQQKLPEEDRRRLLFLRMHHRLSPIFRLASKICPKRNETESWL